MKNFLIVVVVCLIGWGAVYEYRLRRGEQMLSSGDTVSPDGSAPSSMPGAEVDQGETVKRGDDARTGGSYEPASSGAGGTRG